MATNQQDLGMKAPKTPKELGIPYALVTDLVLRRILLDGKANVASLARALALHAGLVDNIVQELRDKKEIEVLGMEGRNYTLALTQFGQKHANDRMAKTRYAGAAPVSLDVYRAVVARQRLAVSVNREVPKDAFSDLVIADELLDELGPALNANGAMFLYGPLAPARRRLPSASFASALTRCWCRERWKSTARSSRSSIRQFTSRLMSSPKNLTPDGCSATAHVLSSVAS